MTQLQDDEKFLTELFNQLTDEDTEETRRKELVLFLKEFFSFSTNFGHLPHVNQKATRGSQYNITKFR